MRKVLRGVYRRRRLVVAADNAGDRGPERERSGGSNAVSCTRVLASARCYRDSRDTKCAYYGAGSPENADRMWICIGDWDHVGFFYRLTLCPANSSRIEDERLDCHNEEIIFVLIFFDFSCDFRKNDTVVKSEFIV